MMQRTVVVALLLVVASGTKIGSNEPRKLHQLAQELEDEPNVWNSAKAYAQAGYTSLLQLASPEEVAEKDKTLQTVPASFETEKELVKAMEEARRAVLVAALMAIIKLALCVGSVVGFIIAYDRNFAQKPIILEEVTAEVKDQEFQSGLFSCFEDPKTFFCVCCCFPCRWADTMRAAGILSFWMGIVVATFLYLIPMMWDRHLGFKGALFLMGCFFAYYRSLLRKSLGMRYTGDDQVKDVLAWTCCCPCAAAQEARQVKFAAKSQEV